jgi:hypothetical protein
MPVVIKKDYYDRRYFMKIFKLALVAATALGLGACSIQVDEGSGHYRHHSNKWDGGGVTAALPNGDTVSFGCPSDMKAFVVSNGRGHDGVIYGCRSEDVPVPEIDGN